MATWSWTGRIERSVLESGTASCPRIALASAGAQRRNKENLFIIVSRRGLVPQVYRAPARQTFAQIYRRQLDHVINDPAHSDRHEQCWNEIESHRPSAKRGMAFRRDPDRQRSHHHEVKEVDGITNPPEPSHEWIPDTQPYHPHTKNYWRDDVG